MIDPIKEILTAAKDSQLSTITYLFIASWSGIIAYLNKIQREKIKFNPLHLLLEVGSSILAGIITAVLCAEVGASYYVTIAAIAVSGHAGSKLLIVYEQVLSARVAAIYDKILGKKDN